MKAIKITKNNIEEISIDTDVVSDEQLKELIGYEPKCASSFPALIKRGIKLFTDKESHKRKADVTMMSTEGEHIVDVIKGTVILVADFNKSLTDEQIDYVKNNISKIEYYNNIRNKYEKAYTFK